MHNINNIHSARSNNKLNNQINSNKLNNDDDDNDQKETILHDIFITFIISVFNGVLNIMSFIINTAQYVGVNLYHYTTTNRYVVYIIKMLIWLIVIPIVDSLYPIFDIERKFDQIVRLYKIDKILKVNDYDTELTQIAWNCYIIHLQKMNRFEYDLFDILISQKIEQINLAITIAINRTDTSPRHITYGTFHSKLHSILGDAVNIRYRNIKNKTFFEGIFNDDSPYRRFKYYDVI